MVDTKQEQDKKKPSEDILEGSKEKKQKTTMEEAPENEWPECWVMPDGECPDQKAANKKEPNEAVSVEFLRKLGIR